MKRQFKILENEKNISDEKISTNCAILLIICTTECARPGKEKLRERIEIQ